MARSSKTKIAKKIPAALSDSIARRALAALLLKWSKDQMDRWAYRLNTAEPTSMADDDLRRYLAHLASGENSELAESLALSAGTCGLTESDDAASASARCSFVASVLERWSKVPGRDVMRIFLADPRADDDDTRAFFAGLELAPNRVFFWRLIHPAYHEGAVNHSSFRQMLWVQRFEFINDCLNDLGRALPIMEIGELASDQNSDALEATVQMLLKPSELAYAIGYGVFQLRVTLPFEPGFEEKTRLRMSLNKLFTRSR